MLNPFVLLHSLRSNSEICLGSVKETPGMGRRLKGGDGSNRLLQLLQDQSIPELLFHDTQIISDSQEGSQWCCTGLMKNQKSVGSKLFRVSISHKYNMGMKWGPTSSHNSAHSSTAILRPSLPEGAPEEKTRPHLVGELLCDFSLLQHLHHLLLQVPLSQGPSLSPH